MDKLMILDLCGGTGAWSRPYVDSGYSVINITLPLYDVKKVIFNDESIDFISKGILRVYCKDVHGILAAPPCTEFSLAKGAASRDFKSAMEIVEACLRIIWHCRMNGNLKFWALENPVGFLRQFLGKPAFTFEQWQFGDEGVVVKYAAGVKRTDLWGYFKLPRPTVKERPSELTKIFPNGRWMSVPKCPPEYMNLNLSRADKRAITPAGFARAFFKANR